MQQQVQRSVGKTLEPPRRDMVRAKVMREVLANVVLRG